MIYVLRLCIKCFLKRHIIFMDCHYLKMTVKDVLIYLLYLVNVVGIVNHNVNISLLLIMLQITRSYEFLCIMYS